MNLETETSKRLRLAEKKNFQFFPDQFPDFMIFEIDDVVDSNNTVFISIVLILFIFPHFRISKEKKIILKTRLYLTYSLSLGHYDLKL